jgi:hypothetical protein
MEIMIVVGIMGLILLLGVPLVYKIGHRAPMSKAIHDVQEVCANARRECILHGHEVDLVIHPRDGRFEVSGGIGGGNGNPAPAAVAFPAPASAPPASGSGYSAVLTGVHIEDLDINKIPGGFMDVESARVRFFPNGTSDELSLFLVSDKGERCEIYLEVTTALANVEWDVRRFR